MSRPTNVWPSSPRSGAASAGDAALPEPDDPVVGRHPHNRATDPGDHSRRHQVRRLERDVHRPGLDAGDPAHGIILHDPAREWHVIDSTRFEALATHEHDLGPDECAALARAAAELVDLTALDRTGEGSFELLWRAAHSEAWLNTWWEPRDTGFHDHGGSCVGVYVLEGAPGPRGSSSEARAASPTIGPASRSRPRPRPSIAWSTSRGR